MATFNYEARTKEGELQIGTVEAGGKEAAIEVLQRHDLIVIRLSEKGGRLSALERLDFFAIVRQ